MNKSNMENIIKGIRQYYPVSDSSLEVLFSYMKKMELPKKHLLIHGGVLDRHVYFIEKGLCGDDVVVVSPDVGGVKRARGLSSWLGCSLAIVDKRRPKPNVSEVMNVIGDIEGKKVIFIDDMIDTGGTIINAAEALIQRGATEAYACCTHAIFSDPAIERIKDSNLKEVIITDTIHLPEDKRLDKIKILSIDKLFSEGIRRVFMNESLSELFVK